jgi:UDP-glucose 4-epimerase
MKENVLVTGGAGFMGSHLAEDLNKRGYNVVVLDDLSGGYKENVPENTKFFEGSITDYGLLEKLFDEYRFDYVFHLAAYAAEGLSHFIRRFNYENNLIGSINLINLSVLHKVKCFVYTSSIAVYGTNQLPMREDIVPKPEDPYGISKYAVELDLKAANEMFGLNYIVFRAHNVYGERQNLNDKYRNVIGIFIRQIMKEEPLTIFGDGKQTRAFSYIGDVSPVIADSINNKQAYNEVFNIGAEKPYSVNELAEMISREFGVELRKKNCPPRNEVEHAYSDHRKLERIFNYRSRYSLEDGIKRMVKWAKKQKIREPERFENIEVEENLPSIWK